MASKAVKQINSGYGARYARKPSKGAGIYALQLPGAGPNGTHRAPLKGEADWTCRCGGCSGRRS